MGSLHRPADPVRLHLGADPPHARRHPPSDLGPRLRLRPGRARVADAWRRWSARSASPSWSGSSAIWSWEASDERPTPHSHAHAARPRPRSRLGASGTRHFWHQRLTAVANVPLTIAFIVIVMALLGRNHAAVVQILGSTARRDHDAAVRRSQHLSHVARHAGDHRGLRPRRELRRSSLLMANTFFCDRRRLAAVFAILKLSFGV